MLNLENVSIDIAGKNIVQNIKLQVHRGQFVGLLGLNGSGKSTIMKAIYGVNAYAGKISLYDKNIKEYELRKLAQEIAVLIQENSADFDFLVQDIVKLGRLPYKKLFDSDTAEDMAIVAKALQLVGMEGFKERYFNSLSGGEKQRVLLARVLAQKADLLLLDEPTNHLDIKNQFAFFEMLSGLGLTVLAVLHDLNIAAKFCDYVYVLHKGSIYKEGTPDKVLNEELLAEVFGIRAKVHRLENGKIYIEYLGSV